MKREYIKQHSDALGEDISMIVYGEKGYPVVAFQTQDSKSNNLEDFGMVDQIADFIDGGQIQLFSVDNVDEESWSDVHGEKNHRAERQEAYFRFVTDELVPQVHQINGSDLRPLAMGCSMGATHAAIAALRRPDLFQGCIALSGVYRSSFFFGDWMNSTLYNNDVTAFLPNMSKDHPYVELYNHRSLVFCVGQGAWEDGLGDTHFIDEQLNRLGVAHWCDFWGTDVNHDWPWWKKQICYFLPYVLDDANKEVAREQAAKGQVSEEPAAKAEPAKPAEEPKAEEAVKAAEPKAEEKAEPATKAPAKKPATRHAAKKAAAPTADETAKPAEAEVKAEEPAKAEAPKAEPKKAAAAKKAPAKKAAAKPAATKAAAGKAEVAEKPAAKKTTTRRAPAKKATTKTATTKSTATKATTATKKAAATTKATPAKKAAAPKTAAKKAATTKTAAAKKADKAE